MSISDTQVRVSYTTDGVTTNFPIPWPFYAAADIVGVLAGSTVTSGYTVTGGAGSTGVPATGSFNFASAPATGQNFQIILEVPLTQLVTLVTGQAFPPLTINQALDRAIQAILRQNDLNSRSVMAPDGDVAPAMTLPAAAARALTLLGFNSAGNAALYPQSTAETVNGTFTGTLSGVSGASACACYYTVTGNMVSCTIVPPAESTGNSSSLSMSGLPAAIIPPTTVQFVPTPDAMFNNNGTLVRAANGHAVAAEVLTNGSINFVLDGGNPWGSGGFTGIAGAITLVWNLV